MKNPFSNVIKLIKKSERIITQRVNNDVFVCDGHYLFKVNKYVYDAYYRTECTCFQELQDGAAAIAENYKTLPEESRTDLKKIYDRMVTDPAAVPVEISRFLYEIPESFNNKGKQKLCRIAGNENFTIALNENFVQAANDIMDFANAPSYWGTGSKQPVFFNTDEAGAVMLPINNNAITDKNYTTCFHVLSC